MGRATRKGVKIDELLTMHHGERKLWVRTRKHGVYITTRYIRARNDRGLMGWNSAQVEVMGSPPWYAYLKRLQDEPTIVCNGTY